MDNKELEKELKVLKRELAANKAELYNMKYEGKLVRISYPGSAYLVQNPKFININDKLMLSEKSGNGILDLVDVSVLPVPLHVDGMHISTDVDIDEAVDIYESFKGHREKRASKLESALEEIKASNKISNDTKEQDDKEIEEAYVEFKDMIKNTQDDANELKNDIIDNMQERVVQVGGLVNKLMEDLQYQDGDDGDS